ncbi:MAG: hypothetical protein COA99_01225 [Moraxellaceae bacterium]|nr:MAG: hypothetical protein COA99_01225 [Moraxellaceae bacterium]
MDQYTGLTSTHYFAPLLDLLTERGFSSADVLQGSGCSEETLKLPNQFINLTQVETIVENAIGLSHDKYLGIQLGQRLNVSAHGSPGIAILTAENSWQALQVAIKYFSLITSLISVQLIEKGEHAILVMTPTPNLSLNIEMFVMQTLMSSLDVMIAFLMGGGTGAAYLHLRYAKDEAYQQFTKRDLSNIRFNQPRNVLKFPKAVLMNPLPLADNAANQKALVDCDLQKTQLATLTSFSAQLYQQLLLYQDILPSIEDVAERLHMSSRTLRRRLKKEHNSYRDLLNQVRIHQATKLLLQDKLPITQVAYQLGYTDSANFTRAFKRHTGITPTEFLARQSIGYNN